MVLVLIVGSEAMNFPSYSLSAAFLVVFVAASVAALWSARAVGELWFPILYLQLMMPLPDGMIAWMDYPMQDFSARIAAYTGSLFGFPVVRTGASLRLIHQSTQIYVAPQCNGMQSLFAMIAIGSVYAFFMKAPPWKRMVFVCIAVLMAYVANLFRLTTLLIGIGSSVYLDRHEQAFDHAMGLCWFVIAVASLIPIAKGMRCGQISSL